MRLRPDPSWDWFDRMVHYFGVVLVITLIVALFYGY